MAEWSHLPIDLLREIQTHLISPFYTVRFRSICSTWRNSVQSNGHNQSTSPIPHLFSKRFILLLSPPPTLNSTKPNSWIIKIEEINPQSFNLFYPLSKTRVNPGLNRFPRVLNILNTRINELGLEFSYHGSDILGDCSLYTEKVAFLPAKNGDVNNFLFLTIHVSGKLAIFDDVSMQWNLVDHFQSPYDDVISFNGDFYAVDNLGRTVVLSVNELDSNNCDVSVVAQPVCGGDKKRLVEMCGELMLVDVYIGFPPFLGDNDEDEEDGCNVVVLDEFIVSRSMWFKVFRLDRELMRWVEVKHLGNNVLFLGINSAFSASADDLYWDRGNCICFNFPGLFLPSIGDEDDEVVKYHCGGVYNLEDSSISFAKVFWPPPSWVTSSS
ncbi:hypothetical protein RND81_14G207400 [Saponaria officinalis]|uniref:KIB1-4 beta-propeller domain-containing protein n=1 Tax=Saponaria officinalis TaxID=3572 RepID=A0AAW1GS56_SAPOF